MPQSSQFSPSDTYDLTATIASGQTKSGVIDLSGVDPCGFFLPAEFDGTTLTFEAAASANGTFYPVYDDSGSLYTLTVDDGRAVGLRNLAPLAGFRFIKLVAGTSQSTTDTVITIAARPI